jgi:hypothetical protein
MIDAAVTAPNDKIYFFSGDQYARYDFGQGRMAAGYPKSSSEWDGLWRRNIDAAVTGIRRSTKPASRKTPRYLDT